VLPNRQLSNYWTFVDGCLYRSGIEGDGGR
jgi:hypothetical protein